MMETAGWIKTVASVLIGMLVPILAVITATTSWSALWTPWIVLIALLGGLRALRDYWSTSPIKQPPIELPGDQGLVVNVNQEPVVEVNAEPPITKEEILRDQGIEE